MTADREGMSSRERLTWLSETLGLADESQDWGIINADAERLDKFVRFLDDTDLAPAEVFQLVELLLASANERLLEDPGADLDAVMRAVARHPEAAEFHLNYWRSLGDAQEFPIGSWLRTRESD
jgi:hypothetical protein